MSKQRELKFRAWDGNKFHYFTAQSGLYGIIPQAIMQFTGVINPTKQELFESDTIKAYRREDSLREKPVIGTVTWLNGCFMVFNCTMHELYRLYQSDWEVIGNIYSNPELLNK